MSNTFYGAVGATSFTSRDSTARYDAPMDVQDDITDYIRPESLEEVRALEKIKLFAQSQGLDLTPEVQRSLFFEYCRTGQIGNNGVNNQAES